jgi:hypothetical protein
MARKKAKSKASKAKPVQKKPAAAKSPHSAKALHDVIRDLIHAKQSGDWTAQQAAAAALGAFAKSKGPAHLQQAAAQAQAVAGNPVMVDSIRLLESVATTIRPGM